MNEATEKKLGALFRRIASDVLAVAELLDEGGEAEPVTRDDAAPFDFNPDDSATPARIVRRLESMRLIPEGGLGSRLRKSIAREWLYMTKYDHVQFATLCESRSVDSILEVLADFRCVGDATIWACRAHHERNGGK